MKNSDTVLDCLYLFNQSKYHRHYSLLEFNWYLIYPLLHNKLRVFYKDGKPTALLTWCWLDSEKASLFLQGKYDLTEQDYVADTGEQLWGIEFIAPFGDVRQAVNEVKQVFRDVYGKGTTVHWRRLHTPHKKLKRTV